jgi:AmmeMemoRadiSam system protein A
MGHLPSPNLTKLKTVATDDALGAALLARARNAIVTSLDGAAGLFPESNHPRLAEPGATFVTLTQNGALRGCIGSLAAHRVLDHDVRENARAAAFRDRRFPPLRSDELRRTRVEVSLLSAAEPMQFLDENDALRQLRPGVEGIILEAGQRRSTFLPQVWESLPEPRQFLAQLKVKAGLTADFWDNSIRLSRYRVDKWKEAEVAHD